MMMRKTTLIVMVCLILFMFGCSAEGEDQNRPLFHELLSTGDEMVQMAGYGQEKLSTVLILGSLHCEATFHSTGDHQPHESWPIPGASVGAYCHSRASERKGKSMVARGVTDEFGDFLVELPSDLHAVPNLEKICTVRVHRIPNGSLCRPVLVKKHKGLKLSSFGNGIRNYTAGNIRLQHSEKLRTGVKRRE